MGEIEPARTDQAGPSEFEAIALALKVLRVHTDSPDQLFFGVWDGWEPRSMSNRETMHKFHISNRSYYLFEGDVSDFDFWPSQQGRAAGAADQGLALPSFIWPLEREWCFAHDVDSHFAVVGCKAMEAAADLLSMEALDTEIVDPLAKQLHYK